MAERLLAEVDSGMTECPEVGRVVGFKQAAHEERRVASPSKRFCDEDQNSPTTLPSRRSPNVWYVA